MNFCTITPTRGDRPQFLDFCKHQLSRMTTKPLASFFIDYKPTSINVDLVPRVQKGIQEAKQAGFERVFIIEDDDYYPANYFDILYDAEFIGSQKTTYYHIGNKSYQDWTHPKRSSLFTTGFNISAIQGFDWPDHNEKFLDLSIWLWVAKERKSVAWMESGAIGIKHGQGICAGSGHRQRNKYNDTQLEWLKANVDSEAYNFYKTVL